MVRVRNERRRPWSYQQGALPNELADSNRFQKFFYYSFKVFPSSHSFYKNSRQQNICMSLNCFRADVFAAMKRLFPSHRCIDVASSILTIGVDRKIIKVIIKIPLLKVILEIRFRKNLAKLTGPAVRLDSKKPKGKKNDERKKKLEVAQPGFEPASQLPPAKKMRLLTTGLCNRRVNSR